MVKIGKYTECPIKEMESVFFSIISLFNYHILSQFRKSLKLFYRQKITKKRKDENIVENPVLMVNT